MNWGLVSAQFAIIAVGACLLMIAGEFDLSVGSMIGFAGVVIAILSVQWGLPMWLSILCAFAVAVALGRGQRVARYQDRTPELHRHPRLPLHPAGPDHLSVHRHHAKDHHRPASRTLPRATGWPRCSAGRFSPGCSSGWATRAWIDVFTRGKREGQPVVDGIPMIMVWAIVLIIVGHYILTRTRFGNWIFAAGGDSEAARYVGVPVDRVKITMFMFTAFCATVFATCQVMEFGSAAADRGLLKEFEAIICVVIGGALLTGGYGSVIGAALGALIFGVVQQGLFFTGVESSLFRVFLGIILLVAVILNTYVRRMITGER